MQRVLAAGKWPCAIQKHSPQPGKRPRTSGKSPRTISSSKIVKLRDLDLIGQAAALRDLAAGAASEAGASGRGSTAARVATLTAAI